MGRGIIGTAALAVALAVAVAPAGAAPPAFDSAQGAGSIAPGTCSFGAVAPGATPFCLSNGRQFSFTAEQRGFGDRATGTYHQSNLVDAGPGVTGDVTCLSVLGNFASFGGVITQDAGRPDFVGVPFVVYVADNGPADSGLDLISPLGVFPQGDTDLALLPPGFPNVCPPPVPSLYGYFPVSQGNIVVDDESPGVTVVR